MARYIGCEYYFDWATVYYNIALNATSTSGVSGCGWDIWSGERMGSKSAVDIHARSSTNTKQVFQAYYQETLLQGSSPSNM